MTRKIKYISILTFVVCLMVDLNAQLTLEQAMQQGRERSIVYHDAVREVKATSYENKFWKSGLKPQVTLDVNFPGYFKTSSEVIQPDGSVQFQSISQNNSRINLGVSQVISATGGELFASTVLQRFDDFSSDLSLYNGVPFRIGINQPLNAFNQFSWDKKIQPLSLAIADKRYIVNLEGINIEVINLYFTLLLAQENLSIAEKNKSINEKLMEIAEERFALGKLSQNDRLQLSLELQSASQDEQRAKFQVKNAYLNLMTYFNVVPDQNVENAVIPEPIDIINIDSESALEYARKNRPEFLEFQRTKLEAAQEVDRNRKNFGIQANLFATYGFARGSDRISDIYADPISEQQVRLGITVPILDWGRKKNAVAIAEVNQVYASQEIEQSTTAFENNVLSTIAAFEQLQQEIISQKQIVETTNERFEISNQRYILGDISTTDLTFAQRDKDTARRSYVRTLQNYWLTYFQLRQLTGFDFINQQNISYQIK